MSIKTSNNKTTQHTIRSFRTWTNVGSCGCNIFDSLVYWSCRHAIVRIARFYRVDLLTSMENTTNTYQRSYRESHFFSFSLSTFPRSVCSRLLFPFSLLCILYMTYIKYDILPFHLKKHSFFYLICDSRLSDSQSIPEWANSCSMNQLFLIAIHRMNENRTQFVLRQRIAKLIIFKL